MAFSRRGGPGPRDATLIYVMSLFVAVMNDFATALIPSCGASLKGV